MQDHYVVIIEWDGNRPPSKWYDRLTKLGLSTTGTGDKNTSVLDRRASWKPGGEGEERALVHQEGTIICQKESTARTLAFLAQELGAKAVSYGNLQIYDLFMTPQDQVALDQIASTLGKRGKPTNITRWVVTCHDEGLTREIEGRQPACCPHCQSFHTTSRAGELTPVKLDETKDPFQEWVSSRFVTGGFEIPRVSEDGAVPSGVPMAFVDVERVNKIPVSIGFDFSSLTFENKLRLYDLVFLALGISEDDRQKTRIKTVADYVANGLSITAATLIAGPKIDKFDLYPFDRLFVRRNLK